MNVASLELCKELYAISGWTFSTTAYADYWMSDPDNPAHISIKRYFGSRNFVEGFVSVPAYDLGYLLRKLPYFIDTKDARGTFELSLKKTHKLYWAGYNKPELGRWLYDKNHGVWERPCEADTPEDAAAALLIELIKQKVITVYPSQKSSNVTATAFSTVIYAVKDVRSRYE